MEYKWIIGLGHHLDMVHDAWCNAFPQLKIKKITVTQDSTYEFDLSALDNELPKSGSAFVAIDERFGNFKRLELMEKIIESGFTLEPFISPHAWIAPTVHVGSNAWIGAGAMIDHQSHIDYNSVLLPGAKIGRNTKIGSSCWIESGAVVGNEVDVGSHCILRNGSMISHGVKIGRNCELGWPQMYRKNIPPKTIFDGRYDAAIHTYEN